MTRMTCSHEFPCSRAACERLSYHAIECVSRKQHIRDWHLLLVSDPMTCCSPQVQQMSRFQLCSDCYQAEQAALVAGALTRLPAGINLGALVGCNLNLMIYPDSMSDGVHKCKTIIKKSLPLRFWA